MRDKTEENASFEIQLLKFGRRTLPTRLRNWCCGTDSPVCLPPATATLKPRLAGLLFRPLSANQKNPSCTVPKQSRKVTQSERHRDRQAFWCQDLRQLHPGQASGYPATLLSKTSSIHRTTLTRFAKRNILKSNVPHHRLTTSILTSLITFSWSRKVIIQSITQVHFRL